MKNAIVFLADGFEEIEAITVIDYLRRANVDVKTVAVPSVTMKKENMPTGSHNITVVADYSFSDFEEAYNKDLPDLVYIPGGMPGSTNVGSCLAVIDFVKKCFNAQKFVSAICAAPAVVLAKTGILMGKNWTCYPSMEEGIENYESVISLTGIDEENILISYFAQKKGVPKVITKVNREELAELADEMGLDCVISPKITIANMLTRYARALENSMGSKVETLYRLMDSNIEALEFTVHQEFVGVKTPLKDMSIKPNILIAGILRGRTAIIPSGDDMIYAGDKVIVISAGKKLHDLSDILK